MRVSIRPSAPVRRWTAMLFLLPAALFTCAGCDGELPPLAQEALTPQEPPPAPNYPLIVPPSVYQAIPKGKEAKIEEALREQKQVRLFRTPALLPALEIVRTREHEFNAAAKVAGLEPRLFQGLIVLECGGKVDAIDYMFRRGQGKRAHVGLGQMGSHEAQSVGLKVSMKHEEALKQETRRALRLLRRRFFDPTVKDPEALEPAIYNSFRRQMKIEEEWKRVDERFHSQKNLIASAKFLRNRMRTYNGDATLAVASYHAGGGNISKAMRLYKNTPKSVAKPNFWHLYAEDSGPAYALMSKWSDNSLNYLPTVVAAADLVEKYLNRPQEFRDEYLYWGPDDAEERLTGVPYLAAALQARQG
jgi:hypothetical protein